MSDKFICITRRSKNDLVFAVNLFLDQEPGWNVVTVTELPITATFSTGPYVECTAYLQKMKM